MKKGLIEGVGINDADYPVQINQKALDGKVSVVWRCPFYTKWADMIRRCYSEKELSRRPTYRGCTVCKEWHRFSNFKAWMEIQDWEGRHLDKDLLCYGNKNYCPEYCVFLSPTVNKFIKESRSTRGKLPIGVCWHERDGKFVSQCSDPFTKKQIFIGYFDSAQGAHFAWLDCKLSFARQLALTETKRVGDALISRYESYIETIY